MARMHVRQAEQLQRVAHELQECDGWPALSVNASLVLYDILVALGADSQQLREILGSSALAFVDELLSRRAPCPAEEAPHAQ